MVKKKGCCDKPPGYNKFYKIEIMSRDGPSIKIRRQTKRAFHVSRPNQENTENEFNIPMDKNEVMEFLKENVEEMVIE